MFNSKFFEDIVSLLPTNITLVAVSKFHPASDILEAYNHGQRIFGESRPQELTAKQAELPKDIQWHMIGHLQTNKIKYIAPFIALIHSADSLKLIEAINLEGAKINRRIPILIQLHVAQEETKQGFTPNELLELLSQNVLQTMQNIDIRGVMAMASLTDDTKQIKNEFTTTNNLFNTIKASYLPSIDTVSMGMSSDHPIAIDCGSTMIRVGSALFGQRTY